MRLMACALVVVLWLVAFFGLPVQAGDPPLFKAGESYIVVWDCIPDWQAAIAAAQLGQPVTPCYMELLTVTVMRKDGWLVVTDLEGFSWTVNPARATGFRKYDDQPQQPRPQAPTTGPTRAEL